MKILFPFTSNQFANFILFFFFGLNHKLLVHDSFEIKNKNWNYCWHVKSIHRDPDLKECKPPL